MNYMSRVGIEFKTVGSKSETSISHLIAKVCNHFDITKNELLGRVRERRMVEARGILSYILLNKRHITSVECGRILKRSHASILHHSKKVEGFICFDADYKRVVTELNQ